MAQIDLPTPFSRLVANVGNPTQELLELLQQIDDCLTDLDTRLTSVEDAAALPVLDESGADLLDETGVAIQEDA